MMNKFEELEQRVEVWAEQTGILAKATPLTQHKKTEEEISELGEALVAQSNEEDVFISKKGKMKETHLEIPDGIGDAMVTLIIQCKMQGLSILNCLEGAVDVIESRLEGGKMVNGQFVKKEDL